ncbi:Hypothetical predicted protein [Marmota monax]|uniref:Homeobox domain-containing protein n=1 Tax=Marmota monax TaxID=9995 RepID=A0A5E4BYK7_MARMO|nr:hypothetical protein GHT09_014812 [Marmota monax]VTJ74565.1 Hypothetical predicted protein [Marmota monax]
MSLRRINFCLKKSEIGEDKLVQLKQKLRSQGLEGSLGVVCVPLVLARVSCGLCLSLALVCVRGVWFACTGMEHAGREAQENTIASSLTAKLNPGLLYPARFEKLDITPKSAQKIKPVLERWMAEAEARHRAGMQNLTEFIGSEPSKKRKRRTSFTPQALEILNAHFEKNTHPSGQEMTEIAEKLNYDREVVRVWFCNKRQALKNTIKRLKQHEPTTAVPLEPLTDSLEENS